MKARRQLPLSTSSNQRGSVILESMVSILIFSVALLGIMGLQAASIRNSNDAKYRTDAAYIANSYLSRIWMDVAFPGSAATDTLRSTDLATRYQSPSGTEYTAWLTEMSGTNSESRISLPRMSEFPPTVTIVPGDTSRSLNVTIEVRWAMPGEATPHRYAVTSAIGRN